MYTKTENGKIILQKYEGDVDEGWRPLPYGPMLQKMAELMWEVWGDTTRFTMYIALYDYDRSFAITVFDKESGLYPLQLTYEWARGGRSHE